MGVASTQLTNQLNFSRKGAEAQRRNYNYCFFLLASWREYNRGDFPNLRGRRRLLSSGPRLNSPTEFNWAGLAEQK